MLTLTNTFSFSMGYQEAADWLFEHGTEDLSPSSDDEGSTSTQRQSTITDKTTLVEAVDILLNKYRDNNRREFRVNKKMLVTLQEMGFNKSDAIEALRITGNNRNAACEWLLGDRRSSLQYLDIGLDPESKICKSLLSNASVQLSLNNPSMLLAFLSMLDNPDSGNLWMNDPDVGPVMNTIFKVYHSEKQSLDSTEDDKDK